MNLHFSHDVPLITGAIISGGSTDSTQPDMDAPAIRGTNGKNKVFRGKKIRGLHMTILKSLLKLRTYQRQQSAVQLKQAEVERDRQAARVQSLEDEVTRAQESLPSHDATFLNDYHTWRLRQELALRRETARLQQRERDVDIQHDRHGKNVRDELAIQNVKTAHEQALSEESRKRESAWMDEIASRSTISAMRKVR